MGIPPLSFLMVVFLMGLSIILGLLLLRSRRKLRRAENECLLLKKQRTDFIANLSHELKTPLTSIQGFTESLRDGAVKDFQLADSFLRKIEDNVERLDSLIHDILDLSRLEASDEHLRIENFLLPPLLKSIEDQFAHRFQQKSQLFRIQNQLTEVRLDAKLLEQALSNLIFNAHRYCQEGAIVELVAKSFSQSGKSFYLFEVIDNGPGIADQDLSRIFERFYRPDKSRNRASGGTGLGLAIVNHIVISHGGMVEALNLPTGGMKFRLLFPAS
ncbi:MAG: sensor histidine kinase [Bdellovibrionota bacterium]